MTRTGAQRYNARLERIFEDARRRRMMALLVMVRDNPDQTAIALHAGFVDDQYRLTTKGEGYLAHLQEVLNGSSTKREPDERPLITCNWCGKPHVYPAQSALEALANCCKGSNGRRVDADRLAAKLPRAEG